MVRVFTLGHSDRSLDELLAVLSAHGIEEVVDVRSHPGSRRLPQFSRGRLEGALPLHGIAYCFLGRALGGLREHVDPSSPHTALPDDGFRRYADHMASDAFAVGVDELLARARRHPAAVLCAERDWSRCHRRYLADHLAGVCGVEVVHLLGASRAEPHRLHPAARVDGDRLVYDREEQPRLPGL